MVACAPVILAFACSMCALRPSSARKRVVVITGGASTCPFTTMFAYKATHKSDWETCWEPRMWVELPHAKQLVSNGGTKFPSCEVDCLVFVQGTERMHRDLPKAKNVVVIGDDRENAFAAFRSHKCVNFHFIFVRMTAAPFAPGRVPQCDTEMLASVVMSWTIGAVEGN
jgi:hypothetical protein